MFKISMFGALVAMVVLTRTTNVRFNREWFMLLCGLFLDLVVVAGEYICVCMSVCIPVSILYHIDMPHKYDHHPNNDLSVPCHNMS